MKSFERWVARRSPSTGRLLSSPYAVVGTVALVFYAYSWLVQPVRPEVGAIFDEPPPMVNMLQTGAATTEANAAQVAYQIKRWGWYGAWFDQYHYARMARSLGRFELPGLEWDHVRNAPKPDATAREPASFSYGLGYPVIGATFFLLGFRGDPFLVPNAILLVLAACLTLRLARHILGQAASVVTVLTLVLAAPFTQYFVIPWGNSLTVVAALVALNVIIGRRWTTAEGLAVGALLSLAYLARYLDAVWIAALLVPFAIRDWRRALRFGLVAGAMLLWAVALSLGTHAAVYGDPLTMPYDFIHRPPGESAWALSRIPGGAVGVFLKGERTSPIRVEPILRTAPWFALAPIGLVLLVRRRHAAMTQLMWAALVAGVSTAAYLAWFAGDDVGLKYYNIRFFSPWFPLYSVLAAAAVEALLRHFGQRNPDLSSPAATG